MTSNGRRRQRTQPPPNAGALFDKLPPHDLPAEVNVIGALLLDSYPSRFAGRVIQTLTPEDFYSPKHAEVYRAIVKAYDSQRPTDLTIVHGILADQGTLEQIGGAEYLESFPAQVSIPDAVMAYADRVREVSDLRRAIEAAARALQVAYETSEPDAAWERIEETLTVAINRHRTQEANKTFAQMLAEEHDRIRRLAEGHEVERFGIPSGLPSLDQMIGGWHPGSLSIVAARPSMGKTALGVHFLAAATKNGDATALVSCEMSKLELVHRLLAYEAIVPLSRIRHHTIVADHFDALVKAEQTLSPLPLYLIDDHKANRLPFIRSTIRDLATNHGVTLAIIDYLQLVSSGEWAESRNIELGQITASLKSLARELNIGIILLSQLNRKIEERSDPTPRLSDLRDSGSIEQDADMVLMIHRDDYAGERGLDDHFMPDGLAKIIVAKNRNGETGVAGCQFNRECARFYP